MRIATQALRYSVGKSTLLACVALTWWSPVSAQDSQVGYASLLYHPQNCEAEDKDYFWTSNTVQIDFSFMDDAMSPAAWKERAARLLAASPRLARLCPNEPTPEDMDFSIVGQGDEEDSGFATAAEARDAMRAYIDRLASAYSRNTPDLQLVELSFGLNKYMER